MTEKRHETTATGPSIPARRPYQTPQITDYGNVALMTRSTTKSTFGDHGGNSMRPS